MKIRLFLFDYLVSEPMPDVVIKLFSGKMKFKVVNMFGDISLKFSQLFYFHTFGPRICNWVVRPSGLFIWMNRAMFQIFVEKLR